MEYKIDVKKKFRYMRIYSMKKRVNDNTNALSRAIQAFVDKHFAGKEKAVREG